MVDDEVELVFGGAHGVSTVVARGAVGGDPAAVGVAADDAEEVRVVRGGDGILYDALGRFGHAAAEFGVGGWGQWGGGCFPGGVDGGARLQGAVGRRVGGFICAGGGGASDVLGVRGEVGELGDGGAVNDGDEAVVVGFLEVHVNDTAGPDVGHGGAVQGVNFGELAGLHGVAAVFGEEDRHRVVFEFLSARLVARGLVAGVTAPGVDVVAPEVDAFVAVLAVEVISHVDTDIRVIVGGIADTNGTVALLLDVGLHVADGRLDESAGIGVVSGVGHLVTGEEAKGVVVLGHLVDNRDVPGVQLSVPLRVAAVNGFIGLRKIGHDVDACVGQCIHTLRVILGRVDGVHTDRVGAEFLHDRNVTLAGRRVGQGVLVGGVSAVIAGDVLCWGELRLCCGIGVERTLVSNTTHVTVHVSMGCIIIDKR